jgi:S-phase kinase-associated protein 1
MSVTLFVDGETIVVPVAAAKQSRMISSIIEDCDDDVIPVPNVEAEVMKSVVDFCEFRSEKRTSSEKSDFDRVFFDVDIGVVLKLVSAANFLDVPDLLDGACDAAAARMRGKTPDELRAILNVKREYTKEEIASVMKENAWAFPENRVFYNRGR